MTTFVFLEETFALRHSCKLLQAIDLKKKLRKLNPLAGFVRINSGLKSSVPTYIFGKEDFAKCMYTC